MNVNCRIVKRYVEYQHCELNKTEEYPDLSRLFLSEDGNSLFLNRCMGKAIDQVNANTGQVEATTAVLHEPCYFKVYRGVWHMCTRVGEIVHQDAQKIFRVFDGNTPKKPDV